MSPGFPFSLLDRERFQFLASRRRALRSLAQGDITLPVGSPVLLLLVSVEHKVKRLLWAALGPVVTIVCVTLAVEEHLSSFHN